MLGDAPMTELHLSQQAATAPRQVLRPSRALVAATTLLAVPSLELEHAVERELADNPALERVDCPSCPLCGRPLLGEHCPGCRPLRAERRPSSGVPIEAVAATPDPAATLLRDVAPVVRGADRPIVEYLVASLDERGFLATTVEEVAGALAVAPDRAAGVLRLLQEAAPAGVGARDLRECLLLQLDRLAEDPRRELARRLVDAYLPSLAGGLYAELARRLGVDRADILGARDFIRSRLTPHPWAGAAAAAPPLVPDVCVRESAGELVVELLEPARLRLVVSPAYERAAGASLTRDERAAVRRQVRAARAFLDRLEQRWSTMRAVAEQAVERQQRFVRSGPRHLVPLTRAEVARSLGVHESTVSRAVAGRNVELPSGTIVPLARFFRPSAAPCDALAELLAGERRPKSDAQLADELASLGFVLARRTVAKYRERLGVLPSALR